MRQPSAGRGCHGEVMGMFTKAEGTSKNTQKTGLSLAIKIMRLHMQTIILMFLFNIITVSPLVHLAFSSLCSG